MVLSPLVAEFFLDGKQVALRTWYAVPRVGDEVMLGSNKPKKAYRVVRVVWGVESSEEDALHRQAMNIEIEEIKNA